MWLVLHQPQGFLKVRHAGVVGPDPMLAGVLGQGTSPVGLLGPVNP